MSLDLLPAPFWIGLIEEIKKNQTILEYLKSGVFRVPGLLFECEVVAHFRVEEVGQE